jgi:site-specific DNA-cytosine methylase
MLVLSLFPGIGLLDMAFEAHGFCVVRGPDSERFRTVFASVGRVIEPED